MKRIESLDYLRGLMALSVMIYHYLSWGGGTVGSEYLIGKLGIYAVSMFYILSGLSLGLVYWGRINNGYDLGSFMIKRIFRIFPLFWLVLTVYLCSSYAAFVLAGRPFDADPLKVFLNYSLLFGFVDPAAYFTTGAWSIGNEMVFYALLPFVFLLSNRSILALPIAVLASIVAGVYFAAYRLDSNDPIVGQWETYINPFNQLFLFMSGVALGVYGKHLKINSVAAVALIVLSFLAFYFFPESGDTIGIVTGAGRFVLSLSCIVFVAGLYFWNPSFKAAPARVLGFFGSACYSIYLLHPLVAKVVVPLLAKLGGSTATGYMAAAVVTLVVSWVVFDYLEKPMMNLGKKVAVAFEGKGRAVILT